jgi:hypothetical protein
LYSRSYSKSLFCNATSVKILSKISCGISQIIEPKPIDGKPAAFWVATYHIHAPKPTAIKSADAFVLQGWINPYEVIVINLWYGDRWHMNRSGKVNTRCMLYVAMIRAARRHHFEAGTYKLGSVRGRDVSY